MEAQPQPAPVRLRSLDALRGFDMLWITGGSALLAALAETTDLGLFDWMAAQTQHVEWHGFRLWDLVFPLFLFVAGAAIPFSLGRRVEAGADVRALSVRMARRVLLLVVLGFVYNGLLRFELEGQRYASVLGRIGLAYGVIHAAQDTKLNVVMTPELALSLCAVTVGMCVFAAISAIIKVVRIDPAVVFSR